jgi:toxin ParE1/3/4
VSSVAFSRRARVDLRAVLLYIAADNPGAAYAFVDEITSLCHGLGRFPERYPERSDIAPGLRSAPYRGYVILYRISVGSVLIERVLHGSRDLSAAVRAR